MSKKLYTTSDFVKYHITGKTTDGKRFKSIYSNFFMADCINLFCGTLFGVKADGKRVILKRVN